MIDDEKEPEDFVRDHQERKQAVAKKRKNERPERDGGRRIHRVGVTKEKWRFDPNSFYGSEDE